MINLELVSFVKNSLTKGDTKEQITYELLKGGGWSSSDVEEAFEYINKPATGTAFKPPFRAPTPPAANPVAANTAVNKDPKTVPSPNVAPTLGGASSPSATAAPRVFTPSSVSAPSRSSFSPTPVPSPSSPADPSVSFSKKSKSPFLKIALIFLTVVVLVITGLYFYGWKIEKEALIEASLQESSLVLPVDNM